MTDRYYIINQRGLATLCADLQDAIASAAEANEMWPTVAPHRVAVMVPLVAEYLALMDRAESHCEGRGRMGSEDGNGKSLSLVYRKPTARRTAWAKRPQEDAK